MIDGSNFTGIPSAAKPQAAEAEQDPRAVYNADGGLVVHVANPSSGSGTAGAALDGTDATGVVPPAGAVGIRGWLSGIYSRVSGTLAVVDSIAEARLSTIASALAGKLNSVITDPTSGAQASVATYHQGDGQTVGGSGSSLLTAGVAQLFNIVGLADRQRATGVDGIPAIGISTGSAQLASPFATTGSTNIAVGAGPSTVGNNAGTGIVVALAALSGLSRGAPWTVTRGTMLLVDIGANAEAAYVLSVNSVALTATIVFGAVGAQFAHNGPYQVSGNVYNQAKDATVADGSTGQGFAAGATYLLNGNLNNGTGGWEGERSAAGELDKASGTGTAVAAEYEFDGIAFDRGRNLQGKGTTATTLGAASAIGAMSVTLVSAAALQPGQKLFIEPGTANEEEAVVAPNFVPTNAANAVVPLRSALVFAHANAAVAKFSRFSSYGPRLAELAPDGIDVAEDIVYARTANGGLGGYFVDTAGDADNISPNNVPEEAIGLYNPATGNMDRLREAPGPAVGAALVSLVPIGVGRLTAVPTTGTAAAPVALGVPPVGTTSFGFYCGANQSVQYTFATSVADAAANFTAGLFATAANATTTSGDNISPDNVAGALGVYVGPVTGTPRYRYV